VKEHTAFIRAMGNEYFGTGKGGIFCVPKDWTDTQIFEFAKSKDDLTCKYPKIIPTITKKTKCSYIGEANVHVELSYLYA